MKASFKNRLWLLIITTYFTSIHPSLSQCLDETQAFVPEKVESLSNNYGTIMSNFQDYLLVSAYANDSLEFNGGMLYLYKMISGQWEKIAHLTPTESFYNMYFGKRTAIGENIIVSAGNTYNQEGYNYDELFIFTKNTGEEWTDATEAYNEILFEDVPETGVIVNNIIINENILAVSYYTAFESTVAFYEIMPNQSIVLVNKIVKDVDTYNGIGSFGKDFDFNTDFVAIGSPYYKPGTNSSKGLIYIYEWADVISGTPPLSIAQLQPENENQTDFGYQVEVDNNTVFASNSYSYSTSSSGPSIYSSEVFVFEKPVGSWTDMTETAVLNTGETNYPGHGHNMIVEGSYIFFSRPYFAENKLYIYKKTSGGWVDSGPTMVFNKTNDFIGDTGVFGTSICTFNNHIVISYVDGNYQFKADNRDKILSYETPSGIYETISTTHQVLTEITYSSSEFRYGTSISYSNNKVAIGASTDQHNGIKRGAVYIYEKNSITEEYDLNATIIPPDGRNYDNFGLSVELNDSLLFVSSIYYDSLNADSTYFQGSIGKVYYYKYDGTSWNLLGSIINPNDITDNNNNHFGRALSYNDGYLAVSQYYSGSSESNGTVHIFKFNESSVLEPIAQMITADQQGGDFFGKNIILNDSLLIVGTGNPEYGYSDEMRVYLFKKGKGDWESGNEDAYLVSSDKHRYDRFGFSIDMYQNLILVGAPGYNYGGTKNFAGKAYVFEMPIDGWNGRIEESLILEPSEPLEEDFFGYDVAIDGGQIIIGAASSINNPYSVWFSADISDLQPGKIYYYDPYYIVEDGLKIRNERYIQLSPNNRYLDGFGYDLEKHDKGIFVSAIYDNNESGFRAGGVYKYDYSTYINKVNAPICTTDGPITLTTNVLGGVWSGKGITDPSSGVFDPTKVTNEGWNIVYYTAGDCKAAISIYVGTPPVLNASAPLTIDKCDYETTSLFIDYTSKTRASVNWFYKANIGSGYNDLSIHTDSLRVIDAGFYRVEVDNGYCGLLSLEFQVNNKSNNTALNLEGPIDVCSYNVKTLSLVSTNTLSSINWYYNDVQYSEFQIKSSLDQIELNKSGYYYAEYQNNGCLYLSDTVQVNFYHEQVELNIPQTICDNVEMSFEALPLGGFWTGQYIDKSGSINTSNQSPGKYVVTYNISKENCLFNSTDSYELIKLPKPQIEINTDKVCSDAPALISLKNNPYDAEVFWYKDGLKESLSDKLETNKPGNYYAKLELDQCFVYSDTINIEYKADSLYVPNVITDNNDGKNDTFNFYFDGVQNPELNILNRAGKIIYSEKSNTPEWIPNNISAGVYYYTIKYNDCNNQSKIIKGWVHLLK